MTVHLVRAVPPGLDMKKLGMTSHSVCSTLGWMTLLGHGPRDLTSKMPFTEGELG